MASARTIVLGDLHLVRETPTAVIDDLVQVVEAHRGARVVFAGDLFDLSADHPRKERAAALRDAVAAQPRVQALLREHLDRGGQVWLLGGNHDAALGDPANETALASLLDVRGAAAQRLKTSPWFMREGGLHLEHGHLYDPDNATTHPLFDNVRSLGVHFVEEFIAPTGAFRYLNNNDGTPLKLLASAFRWYGVRGPYVVYKYFDAAFRAVAKSGPFFRDQAGEQSAERERGFMHAHQIPDELLRGMLDVKVSPTMQSMADTLKRLYLDRVSATCALLAGAGLLTAGQRRAGLWSLGAGALVMSISWALGHDRYGGSVPELLAQGAGRVVEHTGARLVVLGHAHRELVSDRYANTGSFSFPRGGAGRPYLEIEGTPEWPRATLRRAG